MFGFGKQKYEVIIIDPHTKQRTVDGTHTEAQEAIKHVKELRAQHKMAIYKKC